MKKLSVLLSLCIVLILSACSSGPQGTGSSPSTVGTSKSGGTAEPKDLVVALSAEPVSMDPQDTTDGMTYNVTDLIFDKLVAFDKDNKIVPQLATEWTTSADGKKMTFKLREGIKFADGTPFNAEAVKVNFERFLKEKLGRSSLYTEFIDKVNADSDYQVTFDLKFPFGPALASFANPSGVIHSPKNLKENAKEIKKQPVGTGPYKLKEWTSGDKVVLEPNPNYWGDKPQLKSITFKPVPENAARTLMLENGEADIIAPVPITDTERLKNGDNTSVLIKPSSRNLYIGMNTKKAPFNDVKVRQALNYAVDKETIVKKILMGQGIVSEAAIASLTWGFSSAGAYPYDPEKAKQLLAEAGVKQGATIKLWTPDGRYLMDRQIAEFVQANLQAIGFNVEFRKWEWGAYQKAYRDPKSGYDLILVSWAASTSDADWGLRPLFTTKGSNNYTLISDPQIDSLIEQGMKSMDENKRKAAYKEVLGMIKEQAPWIFLVEMGQSVGYRKNIEGIYTTNIETIILRNVVKK